MALAISEPTSDPLKSYIVCYGEFGFVGPFKTEEEAKAYALSNFEGQPLPLGSWRIGTLWIPA